MEEKKTRKQKKIRKNIENICELNKRCVKKLIKEYIYIALGCLVMAVGVSQFFLPNELSTGGFSGIAIIVYYLTNYPMGTIMLILNIPLLLIAYFKVGKQLFIRSIYGTVLFSVFVDILDQINPLTQDKFLACIYGGILMGVGTAVILKFNSSTGGSDLLSYVIRAYKPQYRSSNLILFIDVIIITANVIFFKTIEIGLYSAIAIFLMGKMIDLIFEGINFTKALLIISPHYQEIAETIGKTIDRGSTALYSKGMYTNEKRMTLLCVGSRTEAYAMQNIAKKIDNDAFIIILNAREVIGRGFK